MSPRAERPAVLGCPRCTGRRGGVAGVLTAGALAVGLLLAAAPGALADAPTSVLATTSSPGESWAAELALDGGDDAGVVLSDSGVRLAPGAAGRPAEGVLTLAPRRLASPTKELEGELSADLPAGTGVDVQARGLDPRGGWGAWLTVRAGSPARFTTPTVDVQVRLRLRGGPDGTTTPVAREVWLTARTLPAPAPAPPTTRPTTTPAKATTTTRPTTTTTSRTTPAALWNGAIATTGLTAFKDTPYDITGGSSVRVVDGPPKAIRFSVPSGSQRAEIEPDVPEFSEGQTRYFRLTYVLPSSFPADPQGFQLATQWKNDGTGSPPLEVRVEKGRFVLGGGYGRPGGARLFSTDIAPVVTGKPVEIVVGIRFSSDPGKGQVDVWLDGEQKVAGFRPPGGTLYPGRSSYWKIGLYRHTGNAGTATADLLAAALGTSYEAVR
jgi:hypothetical protein